MSYIVRRCFDNSWRYKRKLVAFATNLPDGAEGSPRARTQQPDRGMSELASIRRWGVCADPDQSSKVK